jgi:hypothetical protein
MKIRLVRVALFHIDRQTDGHDEANGHFSRLFYERAPPKETFGLACDTSPAWTISNIMASTRALWL